MKIEEAYTFDDVLLQPAHSKFGPADADVKTFITNDIKLNIPLLSAAMDTVTEHRLAITMAQLGGMGVLHKNFTIKDQASEVKKVKKFEKIPNTCKWKKGSGTYTTGVAITTTLQTLQEGVQVTFGATIGHAMGEIWTIGISGSITVAHVHYADVFSDYIYTSVEYSNGTVLHHYLGGTIPSKIADTNCPNTKGVVKMENKIWATNGDAVRFSGGQARFRGSWRGQWTGRASCTYQERDFHVGQEHQETGWASQGGTDAVVPAEEDKTPSEEGWATEGGAGITRKRKT